MKAIVSEKGQVTIPKPLRRKLGIQPGVILEFEAQDGRLVVTKSERRDPVDEIWGTMDLGMPVDDFIELLRGR